MADGSKIDYVDATINPLGWGCYGPGGTAAEPKRCEWCYAHRLAKRNLRKCDLCHQFVPHWHPSEWDRPLHWKRPRRIFVQSMGDLFGVGADQDTTAFLFMMVETATQHSYLTLTKEPARMAAQLSDGELPPNLWCGTSVTCQADADKRVPHLLRVPAAVRWLSIEPLLGPVDLSKWLPLPTFPSGVFVEPIDLLPLSRQLSWVVIGRQTGAGAVAPDPAWVQAIVDQCHAAGVAVWLKSNLAWGEQITELPA
ncbi:MAG: DUF5131 family protein [Chloroflexota bacterium]